MFRGIDIDLGTGNPGAVSCERPLAMGLTPLPLFDPFCIPLASIMNSVQVGFYAPGAQGTNINDVTISAYGAYAGFNAIPGAGGLIGNIVIYGKLRLFP